MRTKLVAIFIVIPLLSISCDNTILDPNATLPSDDYSIKMSLGSYIPVIQSREIRIYYKSLFAVKDVNHYQVIVEGDIGIPYPRFWVFTPSSSNTNKSYQVHFSLISDDGKVLAKKTTTIKCLAEPTFSNKNILILGASIYAPGAISKEIKRQLSDTEGKPAGYGLKGINFIGRLNGSKETDIQQEATPGWSWLDFTTETATNPFINPITHKIDFHYYSQQYCNKSSIDVLCLEFGWNSLTKNLSLIESNIKPFLRQYHLDYPDGVIVLGGLQPPSPNGGMGYHYGSSSLWNWLTTFQYVLDYNTAIDSICQDEEFNEYVFYWPACETFDCENAYPSSYIVSNPRTTQTERFDTNGVHPTTAGSLQLSDSAVLAICNALNPN